MRVLTGKLLTGKILEIGVALCLLAGRPAFGADAETLPQPKRLAQNAPAAPAPAAPTPAAPAPAAPAPTIPQVLPPVSPGPEQNAATAEIPKPFHGSVSLEAGNGKIIALVLPAANIYVADPKVAEVRPASSTSLFVFGVGAGRTTIAAVDQLGRLLANYEVTVRPSSFGAREAQAAISRLLPGSRVVVRATGKGMTLSGPVMNASDAAQALIIAKSFVTTDGGTVENEMTISAPSQVTLMVKIAEMKRSTARTIGINWNAIGTLGNIGGQYPGLGIVTAITNKAIQCLGGTAGSNSAVCGSGTFATTAAIDALASEGLAHVLAEPNLTVMSGQAASFQAGGEYPYAVPGGGANPNAVTIDFKPYGVLLSCVPTVLSNGRINLHVKPEVSQLDSTNTVQLPGGGVVDGLLVRRTETTVELGSGETFAIAGMLQTIGNNNNSGTPGLGDIPVLGALFKSNAMTREQTELVIMVTPILVHPVQSMAMLRAPTDGYDVPGDVDRLLLNREVPNRNGIVGAPPPGAAGFIVR